MRNGGVNGKSIAIVLAGGILTYSGVKNIRISTTVRDLIAGKSPTADAASAAVAQADTTPIVGDTGAAGNTAAHNQSIARILATPYGWSVGSEWNALVMLWNRESGWNNTSVNASSGATGIPQSLPPTKMPAAAQAPTYDAASQIRWGLQYIHERYGSPSAAWQHEVEMGWY